MSGDRLQTAEDYEIQEAVIYGERFGDKSFAVNNIIAELTINEDITSPFLTGNILLLDDNNLYDGIKFSGTERLRISLRLPIAGSTVITKVFVITSIERKTKVNDYSSVILATLVEEHGFHGLVQKFSKVYQGKCEKIIENILADTIQKGIFKNYIESFQESFRVVVPYMTPFQACEWIRKKATTENGSPYFLYSSLYTDDLILSDLDTLLRKKPFSDTPFRYSSAFSNAAVNLSIKEKSRLIYNLLDRKQDNTLELVKEGAVGSRYSITNLENGLTRSFHYKYFETHDNINTVGIFNTNQNVVNYDRLFSFNGTYIDQFDSRVIHQLTTPTYVDANNYFEDGDIGKTKKRMDRNGITKFMGKNRLEINVPGLVFLVGDVNAAVGNQISVEVLKNNPAADQSKDIIDLKKSGDYIMTRRKHLFSRKGHIVSLVGVKITNLRP